MRPQINSNRKLRFSIFLTIIFLFSLMGVVVTNAAFLLSNEIFSGVSIAGVPVGGMTMAEAEQALNAYFREKYKNVPIKITYQQLNWSISADEIGLKVDIPALAQKAYAFGRKGSFLQKLRQRFTAIYYGYSIPLEIYYDKNKLQTILQSIAHDVEREPQNAKLIFAGSKLKIIPAVIGRKVDVEVNFAIINSSINSNLPTAVELKVDEIQPHILTTDLEQINDILAAYTTQFDPADQNRSQNIYLAAKSINNVLVRPGEIFSFNAYVGPRLAEYGYMEAPVFIDGKLVPDWGGGVCQVSSTLYNAVLLADMGIEERTSHFRPPGYVPLGQDATVADNQLDFKFRNTSNTNIYLMTEMSSDKLTVFVLGKTSANMPDIKVVAVDKQLLEPKTIIKQDASLEVGKEIIETEGQKGYQVTTYRVKSLNGKEIGREYLAFDEFKPVDRIVRIGTKTITKQTK